MPKLSGGSRFEIRIGVAFDEGEWIYADRYGYLYSVIGVTVTFLDPHLPELTSVYTRVAGRKYLKDGVSLHKRDTVVEHYGDFADVPKAAQDQVLAEYARIQGHLATKLIETALAVD